MRDHPLHIGPFIPEYRFDGDIADTATLEKWFNPKANSQSAQSVTHSPQAN